MSIPTQLYTSCLSSKTTNLQLYKLSLEKLLEMKGNTLKAMAKFNILVNRKIFSVMSENFHRTLMSTH